MVLLPKQYNWASIFHVDLIVYKFIKSRLEPAIGQGTLCGTIIEVNQENKVVEFEQIFKGGKLDK